jgi:hypothetical protein
MIESEWRDVVPIFQNDTPQAVVSIAYDEKCKDKLYVCFLNSVFPFNSINEFKLQMQVL